MSKTSVFLFDESGAVTVDWTVLAAAVVGLGVASVGAVRSGVVSLGTDIDTSLSGASVATLGELGGVEALFFYALRHFSQEQHDSFVDHVRLHATDENLLSSIADYAAVVQEFVAYGDPEAAVYMDELYQLHVVATERGLPWPDDVPTLQDLDTAYTNQFG